MGDTQENNIRNIGVLGGGIGGPAKNAPAQYSSRKRQFLSQESLAFIKKYGMYASDFFAASAQGLDPEDREAWQLVCVRMADIAKPSVTMTRKIDDYKMILVAETWVDYIPPGTKFKAMGSIWLCTNPENISGAYGSGMVERCNAVWNHLDYYGNLLSEPLSVESALAKASASDPQGMMQITKGYFNVKCQYNKDTAQLNTNSRMILGSGAYTITGYSDFTREFTEEEDSVRLLEFTIRYEEPNPEIDDMERRVAGGWNFSWEVLIQGDRFAVPGWTTQLSTVSLRCGETVADTPEHPISYLWGSTDPSVATVDQDGLVTAVGTGSCEIYCALEQNQDMDAHVLFTVAGSDGSPRVELSSRLPEALGAYETLDITCQCFLGNVPQQDAAEWAFSGADEAAYSAEVRGNTVKIMCWEGDVVPLTVTARWKGEEANCTVWLKGL